MFSYVWVIQTVKKIQSDRNIESDDAFFNPNWAGTCWDRWAGTGTAAGPVRWFWMLHSPKKTSNKGESPGARPLLL